MPTLSVGEKGGRGGEGRRVVQKLAYPLILSRLFISLGTPTVKDYVQLPRAKLRAADTVAFRRNKSDTR